MKTAVFLALTSAFGVLCAPSRIARSQDVNCSNLDHLSFFKRSECAESFKRGAALPSDVEDLLGAAIARRQDLCSVIPVCDEEEEFSDKKFRRQDLCSVIPVCDEEEEFSDKKIRRQDLCSVIPVCDEDDFIDGKKLRARMAKKN